MDINKEDRDLFIKAVELCFENGLCSVSLLQRKMNTGYPNAARLIAFMCEAGIVGSFNGSAPRDILITRDKWEKMKKEKAFVLTPPPPKPQIIETPKSAETRASAQDVRIVSTRCPNCGAAIKNSHTSGMHVCDFCGGSFAITGMN